MSLIPGVCEVPPRRRVKPSGSGRDRILRGEISRQREQRVRRQLRPGRTGCGKELGSGWLWQQLSPEGVGIRPGLEHPGRLALTPWAFQTFQICFGKKSLRSVMSIKNGLQSGRELKCLSLGLFFFSFLSCYLKKGSHLQINNWPVIAYSKYLFLNIHLLSTTAILH